MTNTNRFTITIILTLILGGQVQKLKAQTTGTVGFWDLRGNSNTDASLNFLGTATNQPLKFRTNNTQKMQLTTSGKLGIGTNFSPVFKLDVKGGSINTDSLYRINGLPVIVLKGYGSTFLGLTSNVTNTGDQNTFIGNSAGSLNAAGSNNTFIGYTAGSQNTTGNDNIFIGDGAGANNKTGSYNTILGKVAGWLNTADGNSFIGYGSGYANTTGSYNAFLGYRCGQLNESGKLNTFMGNYAGYSNTIANSNTFIGNAAGYSGTDRGGNVAIGDSALFSNTFPSNTGVGAKAGLSNTTGASNVFIGALSGTSNIGGNYNTFTGMTAGYKNISGSNNSFYGREAGYSDTSGSGNSFFGSDAGFTSSNSNDNTFMGYFSGYISTGNSNSFYGRGSGAYNTTGSSNTYIGFGSGGTGASALVNSCAIGANAAVTTNNSLVLGSGVKVGIGTTAPEFKLHVVGGTDATPTGGGYVQVGTTSGTNIVFDNNEIMARSNNNTSPLQLNFDGGLVIINGSNNTGGLTIGTQGAATGYLLSVNGKAICTEMRVELHSNWPDYVFGENYNLRSINELEQFIQLENHLPGVPSAHDMQLKGGLDLGEMQTKLLEKVEELSLYIIQLQKKIEKIENANH